MSSIKEKIYEIVTEHSEAIYNSRNIQSEYLSRYGKSIHVKNITKWLSELYREKKLFRSVRQLTQGYLYSKKNKKGIHEYYQAYLLPPDLRGLKALDAKIQRKPRRINTHTPFPRKLLNSYGILKPTRNFKCFLAKLVGFLMCDGHLRSTLDRCSFFFRYEVDILTFIEEYSSYFPDSKYRKLWSSGCFRLNLRDKKVVALLHKLGAPEGNKVFQSYAIPSWIRNGRKEIQQAFLSVAYGNEGSRPWKGRWRIQCVLSKNKEHLDSLLNFLNDLRDMLLSFDITSTPIQLRKQPGRQYYGRFYISGKENLQKFYKSLEYSYASEKQEALNSLILGPGVLQRNDTREHPLTQG